VNRILLAAQACGDRRVPGDEFLSDPARFVGEDLHLETTAPGELASGFVCTFPGVGYARLEDLERAGLACRLTGAAGWRVGPMRVAGSPSSAVRPSGAESSRVRVHLSTPSKRFLDASNENSKPFVWVKSAEQIPGRIDRQRFKMTVH